MAMARAAGVRAPAVAAGMGRVVRVMVTSTADAGSGVVSQACRGRGVDGGRGGDGFSSGGGAGGGVCGYEGGRGSGVGASWDGRGGDGGGAKG